MVQLLKHMAGFNLIFRHRILAAVGPEADAVPQLIHGVDMVHPPDVHAAQQHDPLQLPHVHMRFRHQLLPLLIEGPGILLQGFRQAVLAQLLRPGPQALQHAVMVAQVFQVIGGLGPVPLRGIFPVQPAAHGKIDHMVRHAQDAVMHILAHQHPAALAVDHLALAVHDIVILQHVLAHFEVAAFNALLGALDLLGQHARRQGLIVLQPQPVHHGADPLGAEEAHQVVLQGDEELGGALVSLPAGPAPQLVIDPAAFMPLRADNMQAAGRRHLVVLLIRLLLELLIQLVVPGPGGQHLLRHILVVSGGGLDDFLFHALLAHGPPRHEFRVAAQQDVRAAARHVGGDGHRAVMAGLGHDLRLPGMVLGVEHLMVDAPLPQHVAQQLGDFHAHRTHQQGLARGVMLQDGIDDRVVLRGLGLVDHVLQILPDVGPVGGNLHHVQGVDALELRFLRLGGTGHAGQLLIHAEVVLEGDGGQGLALPLHLHVLLGFNGLMEPFGIPPADHQAAGEFVHDNHLAVLHHVVHVPLHQDVGPQGAVHIMVQIAVFRVVQVVDAEGPLHLPGAVVRQGDRLLLFLHLVVFVPLQVPHHRVHPVIHLGALFAGAGNDQRRPGLVDQDGVHLVHDGEMMAPLHQVALADHHVVPQVVEAQLVIGAVGDIAGIGRPALLAVQIMHDQAHAQAQEPVHLAHPLAVAAGEVIVHRHDVHALAPQGVQIGGHGGNQGFAFAGLHLRDPALVQHDAAQHLHVIGPHAQHPFRRLPHDRKGVRQDVVLRLPGAQPVPQLLRLGLQLRVAHPVIGIPPGVDLVQGFPQLFQLGIVAGAQQFLDEFKHILPRPVLLANLPRHGQNSTG